MLRFDAFRFIAELPRPPPERRTARLRARDLASARARLEVVAGRADQFRERARSIVQRLGAAAAATRVRREFDYALPILQARIRAAQMMFAAFDTGQSDVTSRDVLITAEEASHLFGRIQGVIWSAERELSSVTSLSQHGRQRVRQR